jgi:hypothetical protein
VSRFTYVQAFEIAKATRRCQHRIYMDGVERAAALAAVEAKTDKEAVDAITREFERHEVLCPKWDGSIA